MFRFLICLFGVGMAHMSMQYPYPRDQLSGVSYAVWQQNEPMYSVHPTICHGLDKDSSIRTGNLFSSNDKVTVDIYGSAPHNGGHCAFWWSTDETTFTKIIDYKDCTLYDTVEIMLPATMSTTCATRCVFAWTWVPVSSGACEVYMNCADIQVKNTTGGVDSSAIQVNFQTSILDNSGCVRVDDTTHWTTIFGTLKTTYTSQDYNGGTSGGTTNTSNTETPLVTVDVGTIDDKILEDDNYCSNPNAPRLNATISNIGLCNSTNYRCDDGQCCSSLGYCGPELAGYNGTTPLYINYQTDRTTKYWTDPDAAVAAYCDNNDGDWRLVPCSSLLQDAGYTHSIGYIMLVGIIISIYNII